jgi:transposase
VVKTGSALRLVPVCLVEEPHAAGRQLNQSHPSTPPTPTPKASAKAALIEIELPGGVCVRVDETVNQAALRRIVAVLRG